MSVLNFAVADQFFETIVPMALGARPILKEDKGWRGAW